MWRCVFIFSNGHGTLTACSHLWFSHFIIGEGIRREEQWEFLLEMFSVQNIFITFSLLPQFLSDPPHPPNFMLSLSKSKRKNPKTPKQTENWKCKQRRKTEKLGSTVLRITPRLQHGLSHQQEENTERFWSEILVAYFFLVQICIQQRSNASLWACGTWGKLRNP